MRRCLLTIWAFGTLWEWQEFILLFYSFPQHNHAKCWSPFWFLRSFRLWFYWTQRTEKWCYQCLLIYRVFLKSCWYLWFRLEFCVRFSQHQSCFSVCFQCCPWDLIRWGQSSYALPWYRCWKDQSFFTFSFHQARVSLIDGWLRPKSRPSWSRWAWWSYRVVTCLCWRFKVSIIFTRLIFWLNSWVFVWFVGRISFHLLLRFLSGCTSRRHHFGLCGQCWSFCLWWWFRIGWKRFFWRIIVRSWSQFFPRFCFMKFWKRWFCFVVGQRGSGWFPWCFQRRWVWRGRHWRWVSCGFWGTFCSERFSSRCWRF